MPNFSAQRIGASAPHVAGGAITSSVEIPKHGLPRLTTASESAGNSVITDYRQFVDGLISDIARARRNDAILGRLFLLERGESSGRLLAAYAQALQRGAFLHLEVDTSIVSKVSHWHERTASAVGELLDVVARHPGRATLRCLLRGNHSKAHIILCQRGISRGYFGGMNIGDRFAEWPDLMLRIDDVDDVLALARASGLHRPGIFEAEGCAQGKNWQFHSSLPDVRVSKFKCRGALEGLECFFADPQAKRISVVTPYIDKHGVSLLARPLSNGVEVTLLVPERPNAYGAANCHAVGILLRRFGKLFHARWLPGMCHAKFAQRENRDGSQTFVGGSANLKSRSLHRLGEIVGTSSEPTLNAAVTSYLEALRGTSQPISAPPHYRKVRAFLEGLLG